MVSLEQSEYLVTNEDGPLSVTIIMNDVQSEDIVVEVTITDGTATGKSMHTLAVTIISKYDYSWDGLQCNSFSV